MSDFRGRRFPVGIIVLCVRWYCKYGISYRDLEEMMSERGVTLDHTTLLRWVQHYAPLMEKRIRWYQRYTDTGCSVSPLEADGGLGQITSLARQCNRARERTLCVL